jgi:ubiquitin-protein ligase
MFLLCALASPVYGEIYAWTDAKGIMHFTNYNPPFQAKLLIKDVRPPRHEAEDEQPAAELRKIQEDVDEKLDETMRRIEDFERNLEDAEILNQSLTRKLIVANQQADAALAYAEELEYKVHEVATLPYSNTLYLNAIYRYPIRYRSRYPIIIPKSRIQHKRFHTKRYSIGRHYKKSTKRSHHRSLTVRTHISKTRSVGVRHKRQLGSRQARKSHRVGVRSNARLGHRNFRK